MPFLVLEKENNFKTIFALFHFKLCHLISLIIFNKRMDKLLFRLHNLLVRDLCVAADAQCLPSSFLHFGLTILLWNMAASQRDMFASSPEPNDPPPVQSSLPSSLVYEYLWVILFEWNVNLEKPFVLYPIENFSSSELKQQWIDGDLEEISRLKKLTFPSLKGKCCSLFCKVEKCK